jgi:hypothetical protein
MEEEISDDGQGSGKLVFVTKQVNKTPPRDTR